MGVLHNAALAIVGTWLFIYRVPLRTRSLADYAEALTTCCCGLSLALLAPLLPWPPPGFRVLALALFGVLFSFCHPVFTAIVVTVPLGIGFGAFLWQFGLCTVVPDTHAFILSLSSFVFVAVFACTPSVAGVHSLRLVLVPSLSALLLTVAVGGLVPSSGALEPKALLLEAPCAAAAGNLRAPLHSLMGWLFVTACAVAFQFLFVCMARARAGKQDGGVRPPGGDLVASLLPEADQDDENVERFKKPDNLQNTRFQMLVKAIYADEGADLSHLTENERSIVEICRKDEDERDRLLWGGGLI